MSASNKWIAAGASVVGRKHLSEGSPCQDSVEVRSSSGFTCVAISDGAGSAAESKHASEILVRQIALLLEKKFDVFFEGEISNVKNRIVRRCVEKIGKESRRRRIDKSELSATLLFVAIKGQRFIAGHIGDGAIGIHRDDKLLTLSAPSNGQYRNETYFLTNRSSVINFRLYRGSTEGAKGFVLATDGATDSLFDYKNLSFAPAVNKIIDWLRLESPENVSRAIEQNLKSVVTSKTLDDCSLAVLRQV